MQFLGKRELYLKGTGISEEQIKVLKKIKLESFGDENLQFIFEREKEIVGGYVLKVASFKVQIDSIMYQINFLISSFSNNTIVTFLVWNHHGEVQKEEAIEQIIPLFKEQGIKIVKHVKQSIQDTVLGQKLVISSRVKRHLMN